MQKIIIYANHPDPYNSVVFPIIQNFVVSIRKRKNYTSEDKMAIQSDTNVI